MQSIAFHYISYTSLLDLFSAPTTLAFFPISSPSTDLENEVIMPERHSFTALNSTFVVDSEYQFVKELGQGAYGCVVAAKHRRSGEGCAIKKITNINTKVRGYFSLRWVELTVCAEDIDEAVSARDKVRSFSLYLDVGWLTVVQAAPPFQRPQKRE